MVPICKPSKRLRNWYRKHEFGEFVKSPLKELARYSVDPETMRIAKAWLGNKKK